MKSTDPAKFEEALKTLTFKYLDDSHSGFSQSSYRVGKAETTEDPIAELEKTMRYLGASMQGHQANQIASMIARMQYYPDFYKNAQEHPGDEDALNMFNYEEVGDTAIVTFDKFAHKKDNYYEEADLEHYADTIELIAYAQKQLTRKDCPIKNVVIDLSMNGGGASNAAAFVTAWYQKAAQFALRDTLTGTQSICSYAADINLDGQFDDNDYLPSKMKRYCLTSDNSFSCGNLVPAAFKSSNVILLGTTTGSGSCIVRPSTTACGSLFQMSGNKEISIVKNGSFYNTDEGIEPDFVLASYDTYYDRQKLVDYIHSLV